MIPPIYSLVIRILRLYDNIEKSNLEIRNLFLRGQYDKLAEKDKAENLCTKISQLKFCYNLALANSQFPWIAKTTINFIQASYYIKEEKTINLSAEEKLAMFENLALVGHSGAQYQYSELIRSNPNKYASSKEQVKKLGKMVIIIKDDCVAKSLVPYSRQQSREQAVLKHLLCYQQLVFEIGYLCKSSS